MLRFNQIEAVMGRGLFLTSLTKEREKGTDLRICFRFRRIRLEMDMFGMHQDEVEKDTHPP